MAPKKRGSTSSKRSSSPSSPPPFEDELLQVFVTIQRITGTRGASCDGLRVEHFEELRRLLPSTAAGSAAEAVKSQRNAQGNAVAAGGEAFLGILKNMDFEVVGGGKEVMNFKAFASHLRNALQKAEHSFSQRKQLLLDGISMLSNLEARTACLAKLARAETIPALEDALKDARGVCAASELAAHRSQLEELKTPFKVSLSTLTGVQHEVEINRSQLIGELRSIASKLFERKAYRIQLAIESDRLQPDDATVESFLAIKAGSDINVVFSEENKWREMPVSEFIDEVEVRLSPIRRAVMKQDIKDGSLAVESLYESYVPLLELAVKLNKTRDDFAAEVDQWPERKEKFEKQLRDGHAEEVQSFASEVSDACKALENELSDAVKSSNEIKTEAQAMLDRCLPMLEQSCRQIDTLCKSHVDELRSLTKPPDIVHHVGKAYCILFQTKETWDMFVHELHEPRFIDKLKCIDKDCIPCRTIRNLDKFVDSCATHLDVELAKKCSFAGGVICQWVHAIRKYYETAVKIDPVRSQLKLLMDKIELDNERLAFYSLCARQCVELERNREGG